MKIKDVFYNTESNISIEAFLFFSAFNILTKIADVSLHFLYAADNYHLDGMRQQFIKHTDRIFATVNSVLKILSIELLPLAEQKGFTAYQQLNLPVFSMEKMPHGHFIHDLQDWQSDWSRESIVRLATDFLNFGAEFKNITIPEFRNYSSEIELEDMQYAEVRYEENLRIYLLKIFHLQSSYDIYLQDTPTENWIIRWLNYAG